MRRFFWSGRGGGYFFGGPTEGEGIKQMFFDPKISENPRDGFLYGLGERGSAFFGGFQVFGKTGAGFR